MFAVYVTSGEWMSWVHVESSQSLTVAQRRADECRQQDLVTAIITLPDRWKQVKMRMSDDEIAHYVR